MEDVRKPLYFLAVQIPGTSDRRLHLTLSLMETDVTPFPPPEMTRDMKALADAILPLTITLGEKDLFGKEKNIAVRHATIDDAAKMAAVSAFAEKYHRPPAAELQFRGAKPTLHVTTNFLSEKEAEQLMTVTGTTMSLGRVGGKGVMLWRNTD